MRNAAELLRDRSLLLNQGASNQIYCVLNVPDHVVLLESTQPELPLGIPTSLGQDVAVLINPHKSEPQFPQVLVGITADLLQRIRAAGQNPRQAYSTRTDTHPPQARARGRDTDTVAPGKRKTSAPGLPDSKRRQGAGR